MEELSHRIRFPRKFQPLFREARYKVFYGGRGSAKSWSIARALVLVAHTGRIGPGYPLIRHRIGCFREIQATIKDSVHRLLKDQIEELGLLPWFEISESSIRSTVTGSEFIFKGLRHNANEIKSTEGLTIVWVEEAQVVSKDSWSWLIPTVRAAGSEIWITFNPDQETDDTYQRFVVHPPANSVVVKVNWQDNPWFPAVLDEERRDMQSRDLDAYDWIWEGNCRSVSEAVIFRGKYVIETFPTPGIDTPEAMPRFFHGADWGFANDPTVLSRMWITNVKPNAGEMARRAEVERTREIKLPPIRNEELWIDAEAYGVRVELDDTAELFDQISTSRTWPIKADCARPETISYMKNRGFNIEAAEKWPGCVEDRIAHLKGFRMIHIHTRCTNHQREYRLYKYKVDKTNGQVLPQVVEQYDHCPDSDGYALDGYILRRGALGVWANL